MSTKTEDETEAKAQLGRIQALMDAKRAGVVLEQAYRALSGKAVPQVTIFAEVEHWVKEAKQTTAHQTHKKYEAVSRAFLKSIRATERSPLLVDVTTEQVREFLSKRLAQTSAATANLERKILRVFFKRAIDNGLLKESPAAPVKFFKSNRKAKRRAFTPEEMTKIYDAAKTPFWRYMILGGFYTGLRLGDLATLRIDEVDFDARMIHRETDKVDGRIVHVPIVTILSKAIREQIGERKAGFVWPAEGARYEKRGASKFSQQFYAILADEKVGIVPARDNRGHKQGRGATRDASKASFHCLRHTFISLLKKTGASQTIAKELAGHSTDAISDLYTHTSPDALAEAVNKLPEFTLPNPQKPSGS